MKKGGKERQIKDPKKKREAGKEQLTETKQV